VLTIGTTTQTPGPRKVPRDTTKRDTTAKKDSTAKPAAKPKDAPKPPPKDTTKRPTDLSVELEDGGGRVVRLPLTDFGAVRVPLESYIYRRKGRDKAAFNTLAEPVMQTYVIPTAAFSKANPAFDPVTLRTVRLVFDKARVGAILLDDVGLTSLKER
jgi:hypothetical protein